MRVFFFLFIIIIYIYSDTIEGYFSCKKTNVANSKRGVINAAVKDTEVTVECKTGHKGGGKWHCNAPTGLNTSYKWS